MKISANWIRDFVSPTASDRDVAEALTVSGIAIEGYFGEGADQTWEAEITTNRVDAMNHYGVAREVSAIYDLDLRPSRQGCRERPCEFLHRHRRRRGLRALHRPRRARSQDRAGPREDRASPRTHRPAQHQQRGRCLQLRAQRNRPSHPRLRPRQARRRQDHRAPRPCGRKHRRRSMASSASYCPKTSSSPTP